MPTHIRGRRRSLDQKKKAEVCDLVARGSTVAEAADVENVSERTVQREAKYDQDFDHELKLALGAAPDPLRVMQTAARAHWRAAACLLERTDPENYGRRPASSASPRQFETALAAVLEAALVATEHDRRAHVYPHVQAACDQAFQNLFPAYGSCGRRIASEPPPTPLADAEHLQQLRNSRPHRQAADYDNASAQPAVRGDAIIDDPPRALPVPTPTAHASTTANEGAQSFSARQFLSPPILSPKIRFPTEFDSRGETERRESAQQPRPSLVGAIRRRNSS